MKQEIPIACSLNDKELSERKENLLQKVARLLVDAQELENGFVYRFPLEDSILENLLEVIKLERKCCPFLDFKLIVEAQNEFVLLELTGQKGAKEAIRSLFRWN